MSDNTYIFQLTKTPLDREVWEPVPFTRVLAFRDGQEVFRGESHGHEYIDNPEDTRFLFVDYGVL